MKYFIVCPYCGQDLLKADDGSFIEITCPKCSKDLTVEVKDYQITVQGLLSENKND